MTDKPIVHSVNGPRQSAVWLGIVAGVIMAAGVLVLWYVIDQRAQQHAGASVDHTLHMNTLLIRQDAENRLLAFDRLARRSLTDREPLQADWEADATRYLTDMPGLLSIAWLDTGLTTRWRVGRADSEGHGNDLGDVPAIRAAIGAAREGATYVFSNVFTDSESNAGVAIVVPVFHHEALEGVIVGVLEPGQWLEAVIGGVQSTDHHLQLSLESRAVYHYSASGDALDNSKTKTSQFETRGLQWTMAVTPATWFLSAGHADSSTLVLIVGLLLSALTTVAVYFAFAARDRSHQFHDIALQLATLFRNLPGMAYRRDQLPYTTMAFVSEGCRALSGYPHKDFADGERDWLDLVHPDDKERVITMIENALSTDEAFEVEYRILDANGEIRWMWERGRAVRSEVEHQQHLEGFVSDITEQRTAESEARMHREQLAHVDRLNILGEMATGIAHEINQPLTAISLFVQAGERMSQEQKFDKLPEIFSKLIQHAHRASAVIERMQSMARRQETARTIIACEDLLRDVVKLAETEARFRDLSIEVDAESGLPEISVDAVQIQQVMLNLLRNAMESIQAVDARNGSVIGVSARQLDDTSIEFAVIDSGEGVGDETVDKLFAPFSTTRKAGMGMGLSISRAIITAHGGRLDFRNNPAAGATFFFTLPIAKKQESS